MLAGMVIGPYTPPFSLIHDLDVVNAFAELGIVILLFIVGTVYKPTAKHRRSLSIAIKKWWSVPENRERMIIAHGGHSSTWHHTAEAKCKISLARTSRPHPHKQKNGWKISSQGRKHMSQAKKQYWSNNNKSKGGERNNKRDNRRNSNNNKK
jgi:hypothetical protein